MFDDLDTRLSRSLGTNTASFVPNLDISEDKENFYIIGELPGLDEKDVKVTLNDDILTITGEKERKEEMKDRDYHRIERSFGTFTRSLSLPANVKANAVSATFRNGLLELTLPKMVTDKATVREIPLNATKQVPSNGQKQVA
jgi:HSP20 family protein